MVVVLVVLMLLSVGDEGGVDDVGLALSVASRRCDVFVVKGRRVEETTRRVICMLQNRMPPMTVREGGRYGQAP